MVPDTVTLGLFAAHVVLLGLVGVQYRRGAIERERVPLLLGTAFTWLSYGLLQVTGEDIVPAGTTANDALNGLAAVLLVAGLSLLYRWWRDRGDDGEAAPASQ
jgi:hypothetical protein